MSKEPVERPTFCDRDTDDAVHDVFCATEPPRIRSLSDLEAALGFSFGSPDAGVASGYYGMVSNSPSRFAVTLLGHSTSLSGELVSPINPRAILMQAGTFLTFNRGVQQVELVSRERRTGAFDFFLVTFEQACNAAPGGCSPGDLYTPRVESDWTRVRVEDDEQLADTPSDCRQCHQRGLDAPVLLMRELHSPWTHFFGPAGEAPGGAPDATGTDLMQDFLAAKQDEPYAGVPSGVLRVTAAFSLEQAVPAGQPVVFDAPDIFDERWPLEAGNYPKTPARSATWYRAWDAFKQGEQLALPYFASRATDPDKQARLTAAYLDYLTGKMPAEGLPDLADIYPDDPQTRAEIGLLTEPGATPAAILVQACGPCHDDVLDQTISRARFNIALSRMSRAELDLAISRLTLPEGTPGRMPPPLRRQLDPSGRERLVNYLTRNVRTTDEDALLEHAARTGMLGGAKP